MRLSDWTINNHELRPTEEDDQIALCQWMDLNNIRYYAIPNGGSRNQLEAYKLKRCGVKRGIPDLCMPMPTKGHHGLYIELKRRGGANGTKEQKEWINYLRSVGYRAEIAKGFDEAQKIIEEYLDLDKSA